MAKHRSGSARRRARRIKELELRLHDFQDRCTEGGDAIDTAVTALQAVVHLAAAVNHTQLELKGEELACLLDMFVVELEAGRAVQQG